MKKIINGIEYETGPYADLTRANLTGAHLTKANLTGAYLSEAYLSGANLSGANLSRANLTRANLYRANLYRAFLSGANLTGANLSRAILSNTILDPNLKCPAYSDSDIETTGLEIDNDKIYGYRTKKSQHCGSTIYEPGQCYEAPYFSICQNTSCHPGLYLASKSWLAENYPDVEYVKCYALRNEIVISGGKIRAKRLWIAEGEI